MSADEMFEKLGYNILPFDVNNTGILFHYIKSSQLSANEKEHILFLKCKEIKTYYTYSSFSKNITMQELQAINEKVKELKWNE